MSEDNTDIRNDDLAAPPPPRKRKAWKRKRAHPAVLRPTDNDYVGVTPLECPIGCNPKRCVITHTGHCGHPRKGALFSHEQMDAGILKRYNAVRKILAMMATAARHRDDE